MPKRPDSIPFEEPSLEELRRKGLTDPSMKDAVVSSGNERGIPTVLDASEKDRRALDAADAEKAASRAQLGSLIDKYTQSKALTALSHEPDLMGQFKDEFFDYVWTDLYGKTMPDGEVLAGSRLKDVVLMSLPEKAQEFLKAHAAEIEERQRRPRRDVA